MDQIHDNPTVVTYNDNNMSSNLYGSGGSSSGTVGGLSPRPSINDTFGLRQRYVVHSKLSASDNNKTNIEGENSHPNNRNTLNNNSNNKSVQSYGKWGSSISNVRAPPRMSLASCSGGKKYGTPNRNNVASASSSNQQQKTNNIKMNTSNNRTAYQSSSIVSLEMLSLETLIIGSFGYCLIGDVHGDA